MNLPINLAFDASVRIDVCREQANECAPLLDYCIEHSTDEQVRQNLKLMRLKLPTHVESGDTEIVSMTCSFIREVHEGLLKSNSAARPPAEMIPLIARVNVVVRAAFERHLGNPEIHDRIVEILKPLGNGKVTDITDLAERVEMVITELNKL